MYFFFEHNEDKMLTKFVNNPKIANYFDVKYLQDVQFL